MINSAKPLKKKLSVVIPVFNEEDVIENTINSVISILGEHDIPFELIIVDDGSKDNTFEIVSHIAESNSCVKGISFNRNFGKESAMMAGIQNVKGDGCVIIDGDLQHPPQLIPEMYDLWCKGYDIVDGIKTKRGKEGFIYKLFVKMFYSSISAAMGVDIENSSDFKILDRKVIDVIIALPETNTFLRGLTLWTGFKTANLEYEVAPRLKGKSKWSLISLISYAIRNIIIFSSAPLSFIGLLALIMLISSAFLAIRAIGLYFNNQAAGGITTVILLISFVGGVILLSLTIIGQYIAGIYDEVKKRPKYLVARRTEKR